MTNLGPSDATDVLLTSSFSDSVCLVACLPFGSQTLGALIPGQTSSISYYLSLPTVANSSVPGAWNLTSRGYFEANFSLFVTPNDNTTGIAPYLNLSTQHIPVEYVCHNHLDCASCLSDPYLLCGWCEQTQTCHSGSISKGPGENIPDCISWDFTFCEPSSVLDLSIQDFLGQRLVNIPSTNVTFDPASQHFR